VKKYFSSYKPFLIFLASFFFSYVMLAFLYQKYLNSFDVNEIDSITKTVGINTQQVLLLFVDNALAIESNSNPYVKLFYNKTYVARIIEGCNAISIIILFISFIIAFSGKLMSTILFIFSGSLIIYVVNILRIAALSVLIFHFPNQQSVLHEVIFPLTLYGVVFILWLFWIQKFSKYAS
jgi:exosortase family protein XrtF